MIEAFVFKLEHKHKRNQQRDLEKCNRCFSIPMCNENSIRTNSMSIIHTILFIVIISSHIKGNKYFFKIIVNSKFLYFVHGLNIQNVTVHSSKN